MKNTLFPKEVLSQNNQIAYQTYLRRPTDENPWNFDVSAIYNFKPIALKLELVPVVV